MSERWQKRLLYGSTITFIISSGVFASALLFFPAYIDNIGVAGFILLIISGAALPIILTPRFRNKKWFLRSSVAASDLLPVLILLEHLFININHNDLILFFGVVITSEFMILGLINIFILKEAGEIKSILILLISIIISFIVLKLSIFRTILPNFDFLLFLFLTISVGFGMFIFGFRCLFELKKNSYLKVISLTACTIIAFGSIVFAAKMQSENVDVLEMIYFIPAFLMTLIVLFSLPFSGYIHWNMMHKKILKKIILVWVFFLLVFAVSFVFPDLFKQIVFKQKKPTYDFRMKDYELTNKNGLEPD